MLKNQFKKIVLYARFSTGEQANGNSLTRQFGNMEKWLSERMRGHSCDVVKMADEGYSGYHGHHRLHGAFGVFEREALSGLHHGTLLITENMDRLSRQGAEEILPVISAFVKSGVTIQFLDGERFEAGQRISMEKIMLAVLRAERALEESERKANLTGDSWDIRYQNAAKTHKAMSGIVCKPWLNVVDGCYEIDPIKVAFVQRIFELADAGMGASRIMRIMNADMQKPANWSHRKRKDLNEYWQRAEINDLLKNRAVIGECQRKTRKSGKLEKNGTTIADFYPVAIPPALFFRVQEAAGARKGFGGGGSSRTVNSLVVGLVKCEKCRAPLMIKRGHYYCTRATQGGSCDNKPSLRYRGASGEGFEKSLLDKVLPLAMGDDYFSNRDEVARVAAVIAEREQALELASEKVAWAHEMAFKKRADPAAAEAYERTADQASGEASAIQAKLDGLRTQLDEARGRVTSEEHLSRITEIRQSIDKVETRLKVAQSLRSLIDIIEFDGTSVVVTLVKNAGVLVFNRSGDFQIAMDFDRDPFSEYRNRRDKLLRNGALGKWAIMPVAKKG